jgi:hypothetical protein
MDHMADTINVRDLADEDIQLIERLVERLRARAKRKTGTGKETQTEEGQIEFATWPLGAKGDLTREEIYDYL